MSVLNVVLSSIGKLELDLTPNNNVFLYNPDSSVQINIGTRSANCDCYIGLYVNDIFKVQYHGNYGGYVTAFIGDKIEAYYSGGTCATGSIWIDDVDTSSTHYLNNSIAANIEIQGSGTTCILNTFNNYDMIFSVRTALDYYENDYTLSGATTLIRFVVQNKPQSYTSTYYDNTYANSISINNDIYGAIYLPDCTHTSIRYGFFIYCPSASHSDMNNMTYENTTIVEISSDKIVAFYYVSD